MVSFIIWWSFRRFGDTVTDASRSRTWWKVGRWMLGAQFLLSHALQKSFYSSAGKHPIGQNFKVYHMQYRIMFRFNKFRMKSPSLPQVVLWPHEVMTQAGQLKTCWLLSDPHLFMNLETWNYETLVGKDPSTVRFHLGVVSLSRQLDTLKIKVPWCSGGQTSGFTIRKLSSFEKPGVPKWSNDRCVQPKLFFRIASWFIFSVVV